MQRLTLALLALLAACGPHYQMDAPDGFVKYTKDHGKFAWITADGVRVKARDVVNEPKAELPFWTDATQRHMTARGYTKKSEKCFTTRAGAKGCTLEWLAPRGNEDWVFAVSIFVTGERVTLVEAAGPYARYVAVEGKLAKALESFEPGP